MAYVLTGHRLITRRPALAALIVCVAILVSTGCTDSDAPRSRTAGESMAHDPGPVHAHGIGIDPADGTVFVATHTGLFELGKGESDAVRVADRYQDTMAFQVVGPGRFLASGHPDGRENLPPYLGLIESTDAGDSWQAVSQLGKVDFHLLAIQGRNVYGFGSVFRREAQVLLASSDEGSTWSRRKVPAALIGMVVQPDDGRSLVASGPNGLYFSSNGGTSWQQGPDRAGLLAWPRKDRLYLADRSGAFSLSSDRGRTWQHVANLGGTVSAFGHGGGRLLAALHSGAIVESLDGGITWRTRWKH